MNRYILILILLIKVIFAKHYLGKLRGHTYERPRQYFPAALRNQNFEGNLDHDWKFGDRLSPVYGFAMWTAVEHTSHFFTEYYINNFTAKSNNVIYHCVKYETLSNGITVNVWVYQPVSKSYNDPTPSMCELCTGDLRRMHRLTNLASGVPISKDPPPKLSAPYKPDFCSPNSVNKRLFKKRMYRYFN